MSARHLSEQRADALVAGVKRGDIRSGARLMRLLDDRVPGAEAVLRRLYPDTGSAWVVGITGNPGSGKSTLVGELIKAYRSADLTVGVVCVDPSSPYTGGAILGDRIRMMEHATDPGVFVHSLATRGQLGGLSRSTDDVVHVLDAMGYDRILVETVGVGQDEIDIVRTAQTAVVVMVPGMGDDIQAIKAGLLEIADIFVVNKADREGARRTAADLRNMQHLAPASGAEAWEVPILPTVALHGEGIDALIEMLDAHQVHLRAAGMLAARLRSRETHLLRNVLTYEVGRRLDAVLDAEGLGEHLVDELVARKTDPYSAADKVMARLFPKATSPSDG